jgi:hypothetical protein
MLAKLRRHAAHHAKLIRHAADLREEITHWQARLSVVLETPMRGLQGAVVVKLRLDRAARHGLARMLLQHWLRIKAVHMRHTAALVEKDHRARLRSEALRAMHQRCCGSGFLLHEPCQGSHAKACGSS